MAVYYKYSEDADYENSSFQAVLLQDPLKNTSKINSWMIPLSVLYDTIDNEYILDRYVK